VEKACHESGAPLAAQAEDSRPKTTRQ
jgi:hypothetical protein